VVVSVFPDDNKKYLSTDLMRTEPVMNDFLSTEILLHNFRAFKRSCHLCCDPETCIENNPMQCSKSLELQACQGNKD
jgi:cysteine synthase A